MTVKTKKDLEKNIQYFSKFSEMISEFNEIIDTGKLAEFYCEKLFDLKLKKPRNSNIDAESPSGKKIEIKQRFYNGKIPPGMKINLENIDYVYYVKLDDKSLLPKYIYKIKSEDIEHTVKGRVSFKKTFNDKKEEIVFQN